MQYDKINIKYVLEEGDRLSRYNYFDDDDIIEEADSASLRDCHGLDKIKAIAKAADKKFDYSAKKAANSIKKDIMLARSYASIDAKDFEAQEYKIYKSKKRIVIIISVFLTILTFAIMVFATVHSINAENKRIKEFNANAGTVCADYIAKYGNCNYENLFNSFGISGYRMNGLCYVREIDFDNDNISELLICYFDGSKYNTEVYGYNKDKKFVTLYQGTAAHGKSEKDDVWITIYSHNGKYYIGEHSEKDLSKVSLLALRSDEFEKKLDCTYDSVTHEFTVKDKVDVSSFERIRLSVLGEKKANIISELVSSTIDKFTDKTGKSIVSSEVGGINSAYSKVIQSYISRYGKSEYVEKDGISYIDGLAAVQLIDFDGDGTDELLLSYRREVLVRGEDNQGNYIATSKHQYYVDIYQYNGSGAKLIFQRDDVSVSLNDTDNKYLVIKTQNGKSFYCSNSFSNTEYGRKIYAASSIFRLGKDGFSEKFKASYATEYGYTKYYINSERVYSKSTFDEKGYEVAMFNGSDEYDSDIFNVTYLQCKTKNAGDMESQVEKTNSTIASLNIK